MKIANKEALLHKLFRHRLEIKSFGVRGLGLFGSFARDTASENSDVDFLVEFESGKKTYDNFFDLALYLEELLGREVEIITPESLRCRSL